MILCPAFSFNLSRITQYYFLKQFLTSRSLKPTEMLSQVQEKEPPVPRALERQLPLMLYHLQVP